MDTPCVKLCKIDEETRRCIGCGRTIDEITNWSKMDCEERRKRMESLK